MLAILNKLVILVLLYLGVGMVVDISWLAYAFHMLATNRGEVIEKINEDFADVYRADLRQSYRVSEETPFPILILLSVPMWPLIVCGLAAVGIRRLRSRIGS